MKAIKQPSYRRLKRKGRADGAFVELDGHRVYLGRYGTPESREEYHRLLAQWSANGGRMPVKVDDLTVAELADRFIAYAEGYYRDREGNPTAEIEHVRAAMRPLTALYGRTPARDFGPLALKAVRQRVIDRGCVKATADDDDGPAAPRSRKYANQTAGRVKMCFRWGVSEQLVPPAVSEALACVSGLKRGRCAARETDPVRPVADEDVDAIREHVSRQVWALVELMRMTGMRAGEAVTMRMIDIDTSKSTWLYAPARHKTQHHGHDRIVPLGPRCQAVLAQFIVGRAVDKPLFSPAEAEAERLAVRSAKRVTPLSCGNRAGVVRVKREPRALGEAYTVESFRRAIRRACIDAGVTPWHPHRLRHTVATQWRELFGIDAAQTLLGHRLGSGITELYAEKNLGRVCELMQRVG